MVLLNAGMLEFSWLRMRIKKEFQIFCRFFMGRLQVLFQGYHNKKPPVHTASEDLYVLRLWIG